VSLRTGFDFDLDGVPGFDRKLVALAARANNQRTIFAELVRIFKRSEARIFATQGAAIQRPWAPLSARYAAQKARRYPGKPILEATGKLRRSLVDHPTVRLRGNTLSIGSNDPKSAWHQRGVPSNNLPARPHVGVTFGDRVAWRKYAARYIAEGRAAAESEGVL
jgi:phage gpG-like protein